MAISLYMGRFFALSLSLIAMSALSFCNPAAASCGGDCDGNGVVAIEELVLAASMTLDETDVAACDALDSDQDGRCTIDELIGAVRFALAGCPATPTPTATSTITPTPTVNEPPSARCLSVYRGFAEEPIDLMLEATDSAPDGLRFTAPTLPQGAVLNHETGNFTWTPTSEQLGPFYLPFLVADSGTPPLSAEGLVAFAISPQDGIAQPTCDPATGCTATLPSVDQPVCDGSPPIRVAEPKVGCPEGRFVSIGANRGFGFGRLHNCDHLRMDVQGGQTGASIRFRIQARCLRTADELVSLQARLATRSRPSVFEGNRSITLAPGGDGFDYGAVIFPIRGSGPFFDLEDSEGNLTVRITDEDGAEVSTAVRVILTSAPQDDLPDVDDMVPPPPTITCAEEEPAG